MKRLSVRTYTFTLALLLPGCGDSGSTGTEATGSTTAGTTETDGPPGAEDNCVLDGPCGDGGVCEAYSCGGRAARFNHFGCSRVACTADGECPSGEACFALVYDRSCEPGVTTCEADGDACLCSASEDCDGIYDAHCLPVEFYPPSEYCDPAAWTCEQLPEWVDALTSARDHHQGEGNAGVADGLATCALAATEALAACP